MKQQPISQQFTANNETNAGDDHVIPFHVKGLEIRGRAVQLGPMLNAILDGHNYPEPVSRLLAQVICLSVLLGSSLKFEGKFIIQIQSDGPVSLLVADFSTPDAVRAHAGFDENRLAENIMEGKTDVQSLLGNGTMAMTIDQGVNTGRYQGIVAIDGLTLEEAAHQYFRQSEQIPTRVKLGVAQLMVARKNGGMRTSWRAGGLSAQFLPSEPERMRTADLPGGEGWQGDDTELSEDDVWREARSLVDTIGDDELTDPGIGVERLLYRLFHQHGVEVYPALPMTNKCGCSRQKITAIINSFSPSEREEAFSGSDKADVIISKCEFCGRRYETVADDLD